MDEMQSKILKLKLAKVPEEFLSTEDLKETIMCVEQAQKIGEFENNEKQQN